MELCNENRKTLKVGGRDKKAAVVGWVSPEYLDSDPY